MRLLPEQNSKLYGLLTKLTLLVELNILVLLCCLPVITAGAALCSMHAVLLKIYRDDEASVFKDFKTAMRSNLKNGTVLWLLLLGYLAVLSIPGYFAWKSGSDSAAYIIFALLIAACIGCLYMGWAFILQSRYVYTAGQCLKYAMLAWMQYPGSTFVYLVSGILPLLLCFSIKTLPLVLLVGITLPAFISTTLYIRVFDEIEKEQAVPEV